MLVVRRSGAYRALILLLSSMFLVGSAVAQTLTSTETPTRTDSEPQQAVLVDLNADRNLDLVVAETNGKLDLMLGDGNGGLTAAIALAEGVVSVASGHFVGDSASDLVVIAHGESGAAALFLYQNYGAQGLGERKPVPSQVGLDDTCRLASGDFDSDGYSDIAIYCASQATQLTIGYGTGHAEFSFSSVPLGESRRVRSVSAFDLDDDGMADLAILSEGPDGQRDVRVAWGTDTRRAQPPSTILRGSADEVLAGSLDGNAGSVIVRSGGVLSFLSGAEKGRAFRQSGTVSLSEECSIKGAAVGPMRRTANDSSVLASDLVVASDCGNSGSMSIWRNSGATSLRIVPLNSKRGDAQAFRIHVSSLGGGLGPSGSVHVWLDKKATQTVRLVDGRATYRTHLSPGVHSVYAAYVSDSVGSSSAATKIYLVGSGTEDLAYPESKSGGGTRFAVYTPDAKPRLLAVSGNPVSIMATSLSPGSNVAAATQLTFSVTYQGNTPNVFSCGDTNPPATCSGGNQSPQGGARFLVDGSAMSITSTGGSSTTVSCGQDHTGVPYYCQSVEVQPTAAYTLPSGNHTVTMQWIGSGPDGNSGVTTWNVTVQPKVTPSVGVTASPSTVTYGVNNITASVHVSCNSACGSVSFLVDGSTWTSASLDGSGNATVGGPNGPGPGNHTVQVNFSGNAAYNAASGSTGYTIAKNTPSVSLSANHPSVTYGNLTVFTATLGGGTSPSGSVAFEIQGAVFGTVGVSGNSATFNGNNEVWGVGSWTISAVYSGDSLNNSATGVISNFTVNKATPSTTITSSASSVAAGGSVTLTAHLANTGAVGSSPSGTVTFIDGSTSIGSGTLSNGVASLTTASLSNGAHSFSTSYSGDGNFVSANSSAITVQSGPAPVLLDIFPTPSSITAGSSVALRAVVNTGGARSASGIVSFFSNGTSVGSATLSPATTTNLLPNTYLGGSGDVNGSSYALNNQVAPDGTTTAETIAYAPITSREEYQGEQSNVIPAAGSTYTFSVWLKAAAPTPVTLRMVQGCGTNDKTYQVTAGTTWQRFSLTETMVNPCSTNGLLMRLNMFGPLPNTTVIFAWGAQLEQAALPGPFIPTSGTPATGTGAVATLTTSSLPAGTDMTTNSYAGDASNQSATGGPVIVQVAKASPALVLTSSANPSITGSTITFTATISSGDSPTGSITFLDGATVLGTGVISGGVATFSTNSLAFGTHPLTASFGGDANNSAVTSNAVSQVVNKGAPTLAFSSSKNPALYGGSITFTAGLPANATGTVTFLDGATTIGNAPISGGAASFSTSSFSVGTHSITANYGGDSNYIASTAALSQVVNKAPITMNVTSSLSPSLYKQSVILNLSSNGSGAVPSGTVSVMDGTTSLGSLTLTPAGTAAITTNTLTAGTHNFTFTYNGDANYY